MKLIHYYIPAVGGVWAAVDNVEVRDLAIDKECAGGFLASLLQWPDPTAVIRDAFARSRAAAGRLTELPISMPDPAHPHLLPPVDHQEVWAAGVTYQRSKVARMKESEGAARFYDLVYDADRPELFFKATPSRVTGHRGRVRIREDARWNVPEPEIALLISPRMEIVGFTIGNDMSSRDIEGENPLYLPQAKVYRESCALGPAVLLSDQRRDHREFQLEMTIERDGKNVFSGSTSTGKMKRHFADLVQWLGRDNLFPHGAYLLTGTGLVPGDDFSLEAGDVVSITVPEIGTLQNHVVRGGTPT